MSVTIRAATEADIAAMQVIEVDAGGRFRAIGLDVVAGDPPFEADVLLGYVTTGLGWVAVEHPDDGGPPTPLGYALAPVVDREGPSTRSACWKGRPGAASVQPS